ncbi:tetratricopeptide repeat protein [Sphingomonas adhaesiva]|uniref:tetratricopeptide repeat protein n=1 Tax=Sphingomonas adhaesiva TaxID=28212 RepID=UPI002FF89814
MREGPLAQPVRPRPSRTLLRWRAIGVIAALMLAAIAIVALARRADRVDPATAMREGQAAWARGNYSAARNHFLAAVATQPANGAAQLALARTWLLLGEGVPAQGALDRAAAAGIAAATLAPWQAAAAQAQGDAAGALAAAAGAGDDPVALRAKARALADQGDAPTAMATLQAVLARTPDDAAAWTDLGRIRLDVGDVGGATQAASRAVALDRRYPAALVLAGEVMRSRYGLNAAVPWFEAALRLDAYYHPALIEYAGTLGDMGRSADAVAAARRALAVRRDSAPALYLLATIAARAGNMALAGQLLDRTGGALNGLPGGLLLSGGVDYAAGRYEQAVVKWRALIGIQPMNVTARRLLGAALLRSGDAGGALDVLRPIALRADADSYTLGLVGRAFEAQGKRDWAARFLDRAANPGATMAAPFGQDDSAAVLAEAVADAPGDPRAAVSLVRGLLEQSRGGEALAAAQRLVRQSPGAPAAHVLEGDVLIALHRAGGAAASYARAADLRFDQPVLLRLVEARVLAGDRTGAADALALYLAQNPQNVVARRALAGLQRAADDDEAIDTLERLRGALGGRDVVVMAALADAYVAADDPATALPIARAAYRLQPMSAMASDAWGQALLGRGDATGALALLDKASAIAPDDLRIRWHRAQALVEAGRDAEARGLLTTLMRSPDGAAARQLLESLPPG